MIVPGLIPAACRGPRACTRLLYVLLLLLVLLAEGGWRLGARDFTVAVYNVENLFDVDGIAAYEEYQSSGYTPAHLRTKLSNISTLISRLCADGRGPDIILLNEIEADRSPSPSTADLRRLLAAQSGRTVDQLLSAPLAADLADWPAEAWLLKALEDRGLTGYTVVSGTDGLDASGKPTARPPAVKNLVLTRFPVLEVRNHPLESARNLLEVLVSVDGRPLRLFNNHWKSGASDERSEPVRAANARVLRARLDELLAEDPRADIILGGDFNSQYNQKARYPRMRETGINDILRSQGNERALQTGAADLYNLWYELPEKQRGSDTYQGEWGTLMQMLLTPGLYDHVGVQYVDNSFRVARLTGLNANDEGLPVRWVASAGKAGAGFSDHFPLLADFTTVPTAEPTRWLSLRNPSDGHTPSEPVLLTPPSTNLAAKVRDLASLPESVDLRDGTHNDKLFQVRATVSRASSQKVVKVHVRGQDWEIYCPDRSLSDYLKKNWEPGQAVRFVGELGEYKGRWQFKIKDRSWLLPAQ